MNVANIIYGTTDTAVTTGGTAHVVFYQRKVACPRCDRPARDDAEWRRWALEEIAEVARGE